MTANRVCPSIKAIKPHCIFSCSVPKDAIRRGVRKVESGGQLSDKEIKDIITALKKYRNENIRLGELIPGIKIFACLHFFFTRKSFLVTLKQSDGGR